MTVEYEMTPDDLVAFNVYHHRRSPTARRRYLWSWFFPAGAWLFACTALWHLAGRGRGTPLQTFLALLPLFLAVPVYLLWYPWAYRRNLRKNHPTHSVFGCQFSGIPHPPPHLYPLAAAQRAHFVPSHVLSPAGRDMNMRICNEA